MRLEHECVNKVSVATALGGGHEAAATEQLALTSTFQKHGAALAVVLSEPLMPTRGGGVCAGERVAIFRSSAPMQSFNQALSEIAGYESQSLICS